MRCGWMIFPMSLLAALAGCGNSGTGGAEPRPVLVRPAAPALVRGVSLAGEVRARHEADLAFRVGGKIVARLVDAGAEVKAGTPLARLDPADLQLAAQAARAQLAAAESDAATTRADRERYADLLAKKFVSQAAFDARDNAAKAAQARLEQARAQAAVSGNQLNYGTLLADQAGVITTVFADAGQVVGAGQPVMRLARPDEKEVLVAVPEGRVNELKAARDIQVTLWALPELRLKGELRELSPAADASTRTYAARVRLLDPPPEVRLGMTARISIGAEGGSGPIVVPLAAVIDQGRGPMVWLVVDGKVKAQAVVVQQFREDGAVIASGLQGSEMVVVAGATRLVADQAVKPQLAPEVGR